LRGIVLGALFARPRAWYFAAIEVMISAPRIRVIADLSQIFRAANIVDAHPDGRALAIRCNAN
jgi:hypothetical protein